MKSLSGLFSPVVSTLGSIHPNVFGHCSRSLILLGCLLLATVLNAFFTWIIFLSCLFLFMFFIFMWIRHWNRAGTWTNIVQLYIKVTRVVVALTVGRRVALWVGKQPLWLQGVPLLQNGIAWVCDEGSHNDWNVNIRLCDIFTYKRHLIAIHQLRVNWRYLEGEWCPQR